MPQPPDPPAAATDVAASTEASFKTAAAIPPPVAGPAAAAPQCPGHIGRYRVDGGDRPRRHGRRAQGTTRTSAATWPSRC